MKRLRLTALVVLAGLVLVVVFLLLPSPPASPWLALPDGSSVRIAAVTYGTNHVMGPLLGRLIARLPQKLGDPLVKMSRNRLAVQRVTAAAPELVVWLESRNYATNSPYTITCLGDGSNYMAGMFGAFYGGSQIAPVDFKQAPRRDPIIAINFFPQKTPTGPTNHWSLKFPNPLYRPYPEWRPETLPATKRVGDVEVTLLGLHTGYHTVIPEIRPASNQTVEIKERFPDLTVGMRTVVDLRVRSLSNTNAAWNVWAVQASDATGNQADVSGSILACGSGDAGGSIFYPGLWPVEKAWKVKLMIKLVRGLSPEKLLSFKNVPLGTVGSPSLLGWTSNLAGVTVTLDSISRQPPITNFAASPAQNSTVRFLNSKLPAGVELNLLSVTYDDGTTGQPAFWGRHGDQLHILLQCHSAGSENSGFQLRRAAKPPDGGIHRASGVASA